MKYVCLQCNQISQNPNLYCQELNCPAERSPVLLDFGEWLGDIEIVKRVTILHTSVVYEAIHNNEKVFLKIAHPGHEHTERIKREAEFLRTHTHTMLPRLRPPYAGTKLEANNTCGKAILGNQLHYFYMFDYWEGDPLSEILTQNPQLWINHVGWITIGVAEVLNLMHAERTMHLGVLPESILVRFDQDEVRTPRVLLIDLGIASRDSTLAAQWYSFSSPPGYTAPELLDLKQTTLAPSFRTDVYGLGLILYEMLIGRPAFTHKHRNYAEVQESVLNHQIAAMTRGEDVSRVADVATQAVSRDANERYENIAQFGQVLTAIFGEIPEKKTRQWPSSQTILVVISAILTIAILIAFAISIG